MSDSIVQIRQLLHYGYGSQRLPCYRLISLDGRLSQQ